MSAYARVTDVIPCPSTLDGRHDWIDARHTSDQLYSGECSICAALLIQRWWGWEFYTGEEHFDHDAWTFEELHKITKPHRRGLLAEEEDAEDIPMRFDPIPALIGPNTRAIYRPQELGAPVPIEDRLRGEEGVVLAQVAQGENWAIYAGDVMNLENRDPLANAIARAEAAPRRGRFAQAMYRGLRAHEEEVRDGEGHLL